MNDNFTNPATGAFYNYLNITDKEELAAKEGSYSVPRMVELLVGVHEITGTYDAQHLRALNAYIFQDVYSWAGQTRAEAEFQGQKPTHASGVPDGTVMRYAPYRQIEEGLNAIGAQLGQEHCLRGLTAEAFAERAAYYFDQYNYVHAFREGNGRTLQAAFHQLGREAGYEVDFTQAGVAMALNEARDTAIVRPHGPEQPALNLAGLTQLFRRSVTPLDEPGAEELRDPALARPLATPSPALQRYEAMRVTQASAVVVGEALRDLDRGDARRANAFRRQVEGATLDPLQLPALSGLVEDTAREVRAHPALRQEPKLLQDLRRLEQSVAQLQVRPTAPPGKPTLPTLPMTREIFVEVACRLAEGLDEEGYPGPAGDLVQAAKTVGRQQSLEGTTLHTVSRALKVAEKRATLAEAVKRVRQAKDDLQEAQRDAASRSA